MKYVNKYLYMVFLFFIICILVSSVSAVQFKTDYDLTTKSFDSYYADSGHYSFHLDVPSESDFILVDNLSGEVKNNYVEGDLSFYVNEGKYADAVYSMIFIKDYGDEGAIISDTFTDLIGNATIISSSDNVSIYEFNNTNMKYGAFIINDEGDKGLCISANDLDLLNDMAQSVELY